MSTHPNQSLVKLTNMKTLKERILFLIDYTKRNQSEIAKAAGVSRAAVSDWVKGNVLTMSSVPAANLEKEYGVSATWLATGAGDKFVRRVLAAEDDFEKNTVKIKKVEIVLRAGIDGYEISQVIEEGNPIYFRRDWLIKRGYKQENLIAVTVHGDSMEPGLFDGDTVVINIAEREPVDGAVFAINYEGEPTIKRLFRDSGSWWLLSDNPDQRRHAKKECSEGVCVIIGRVIHKQSERI